MVYIEGEVMVVRATSLVRKDRTEIRVQHVVLLGTDGTMASGYVPIDWKVELNKKVRWPVVSASLRSRVFRFWCS